MPALKIPCREAHGRWLRRVYLSLLAIMLISWVFRIVAYYLDRTWRQAASLAGIPGSVVLGGVVLCYGLAIGLALWPREWQTNGEVHETKYGEWKDSSSGEHDEQQTGRPLTP